jgi:hypothetical protein
MDYIEASRHQLQSALKLWPKLIFWKEKNMTILISSRKVRNNHLVYAFAPVCREWVYSNIIIARARSRRERLEQGGLA